MASTQEEAQDKIMKKFADDGIPIKKKNKKVAKEEIAVEASVEVSKTKKEPSPQTCQARAGGDASPPKSKLDGTIFKAIKDFDEDLWTVFGRPKKRMEPLSLYHKLLIGVKKSDHEIMRKIIEGFVAFFATFDSFISNKIGSIPEDATIRFGDSEKVKIEIGSYLKKANPSTIDSIQAHLLTISNLIAPSEKKIKALKDNNSKEAKFMKNIIQTAQSKLADTDLSLDDPMATITALGTSGVIQDLMSSLKNGSEGLNAKKMMREMQKLMASMVDSDSEEDEDDD